jgi:hypothetical protein
MKPISNIFQKLAMALMPMTFIGLSSLTAAPMDPSTSTATNAPALSVFIMPENPKEGRDPFFPKSPRVYKDRPNPSGTVDASSLKLEGISNVRNNELVIINGETFGVGDEANVKTNSGKVHVRCIQIKANSAVVEVGGQIITLNLSNP